MLLLLKMNQIELCACYTYARVIRDVSTFIFAQIISRSRRLSDGLCFLDPTTGDATDWTYASLGIIHSYSIELRPTFQDERGFIVPPEQIVESGNEILSGMMEMARFLDE